MKETNFIEQNKEKWSEFEQILNRKKKNPDKLNDLFIQVTDDLSYSRTFYPNRSVRVYLNNISQKIFHNIYKNRKLRWKKIVTFWTEELPYVFWHSKKDFLISFIIFALAMAVGVVSSINDPDFARTILGDMYISMTEANIANDDPMAVYKDDDGIMMFIGITLNNIRVAFLTFVSGILLGIGSILVLIYNGVMVGTFQYFFIERGLFWESFLTIWVHGTLEISVIIIAGGAGIMLGRGILFPGNYTRVQSIIISGKRAIKVMLSVMPIFVLAGFIESFLTRYTETPDIIRFVFIMLCLAFILGFYVFLPFFKWRAGFKFKPRKEEFKATKTNRINFTIIKGVGEVFTETFYMLRKHSKRVFIPIAVMAAIYAPLHYFFILEHIEYRYLGGYAEFLFGTPNVYFGYKSSLLLYGLNCVFFAVVYLICNHTLVKDSEDGEHKFTLKGVLGAFARYFMPALSAAAIFGACFFTLPVLNVILIIILAPLLNIWLIYIQKEKNFLRSIGATFKTIKSHFGKVILVQLILAFFILLGFVFLSEDVIYFLLEAVNMVVFGSETVRAAVHGIFTSFIVMFLLGTLTAFSAYIYGLLYFSMVEINEANTLRKDIESIGEKRSVYGLEQEVI